MLWKNPFRASARTYVRWFLIPYRLLADYLLITASLLTTYCLLTVKLIAWNASKERRKKVCQLRRRQRTKIERLYHWRRRCRLRLNRSTLFSPITPIMKAFPLIRTGLKELIQTKLGPQISKSVRMCARREERTWFAFTADLRHATGVVASADHLPTYRKFWLYTNCGRKRYSAANLTNYALTKRSLLSVAFTNCHELSFLSSAQTFSLMPLLSMYTVQPVSSDTLAELLKDQ